MSASLKLAIAYANTNRTWKEVPTNVLSLGQHAFDTGYVTLSYTVLGSGPLVIAQIPGWGIGQSYLSDGLASLHDSFSILYLNPRGTPPSSRPTEPSAMSSAHMVEDLESLRRYLGLETMTLLGHSNGGSITLGYSQRYPDRVVDLILLGHELQGFDDSATYIEFAMKRKDDPVYNTALMRLQTFKAESDEEMQEALMGILPFYFANPTLSMPTLMETMKGPPSSWALNAQRAADRRAPTYLVDHLDSVTARTLILVGREDALCSVKAAERAHAGIKGSRLVIIEDCGNFAWIEKKEEVLDAVSRFLEG